MARIASSLLLGAGLVLIAAGGAAVAFGVTREVEGGMPPEANHELGEVATRFEREVDKLADTLAGHASSLASIDKVRELDSTDAATLNDPRNGGVDYGFKPDEGDIVTLGQTMNDPKMPLAELVTLPLGAHSPSLYGGKTGTYLAVSGGADKPTLAVTVIGTVKLTADAKPPVATGFVAVSSMLDLAPQLAAIRGAGIDGEVVVGDTRIPINKGVGTSDAIATKPLHATPPVALRYVERPKLAPAIATPAIAGGAGAGVFGLVLLLVGMMRRGRTQPAPAVAAAENTGSMMATNQLAAQSGETKYTAPQSAVSTSSIATAAARPSLNGAGGATSGQMIGRWEVIRRLGSGGMADVYLARARGEAGFEKLVALKVMHAHLARNTRAVEHFLDEAKLAANVHHANVVAIQDLGKIGDEYVIVMEYVDGVDLERLLMSARTGSRPVPVAIGLGILCRICDGLSAAHKATGTDGTPLGLIHRDVKSANVLVSKQGGVKVVDFGIAKAATQSHLTMAGETKGTPSMMAPEQRVGEQVDVRADVYSVAAVGFEILTNHGVNLDLAALAHLGVENWPHLPLPSALRRELPLEIDALLLGAMAFERDKRPADCDVFELSFEEVMKKHGLSATDKDIARWVETEMAFVQPQPQRPSQSDLANKVTG